MDIEFIKFLLVFFTIFIAPVLIIVAIVVHFFKADAKKANEQQLAMFDEIKRNDLYFDVDLFKENAGWCIREVFKCFLTNDLERLRTLESADLFEIHKIDIETGWISGYIRTLDVSQNINFNFDRYYIDGDKEIIVCSAFITSKEIIFDPKTKENLNDESRYVLHNMKLEFSRHLGVKTIPGREFAIKECPNCGAKIGINEYGKCSYCDSVIVNGEHSWVLHKISDLYTN